MMLTIQKNYDIMNSASRLSGIVCGAQVPVLLSKARLCIPFRFGVNDKTTNSRRNSLMERSAIR